MTQSRYEVKAWVRSNLGVLLRSGKGFNMAVYQEMLAALRPSNPPPPPRPLNTVLILPDGNEKIMRGMFELFDEVTKAGGIRVLFPGVSVVIRDGTSDK